MLEETRNNLGTEEAEKSLQKIKSKINTFIEKQEKLDEQFLNNLLISSNSKTHAYNRLTEKIENDVELLNKQKEYLEEEIIQKTKNKLDREQIRRIFQEFEMVYYASERLEKKALLRALIKKIGVSKDRKHLEFIEFWFFPDYRLPVNKIRRTVP